MSGYIERPEEPAWYTVKRKLDWLIYGLMIGVYIAAIELTDDFKALAITLTIGMFCFVLRIMRAYIFEAWFRTAIAFLVVLHVGAIIFFDVRLPSGPSIAYVPPVVFADMFAMYGILEWLRSRFSKLR